MVKGRKRGAIEGGRGYCLHADSVPHVFKHQIGDGAAIKHAPGGDGTPIKHTRRCGWEKLTSRRASWQTCALDQRTAGTCTTFRASQRPVPHRGSRRCIRNRHRSTPQANNLSQHHKG